MVENLIKKFHLESRIFLVGKKERAEVFLKAFNIFILTSVKEGLPYVILEAGVAGLPVVASAVGGIPEIITDMHSGILVKQKHEDEIALALEYIISSKEKREDFGRTLNEQIMRKFSLSGMVNATIELYRQQATRGIKK